MIRHIDLHKMISRDMRYEQERGVVMLRGLQLYLQIEDRTAAVMPSFLMIFIKNALRFAAVVGITMYLLEILTKVKSFTEYSSSTLLEFL